MNKRRKVIERWRLPRTRDARVSAAAPSTPEEAHH